MPLRLVGELPMQLAHRRVCQAAGQAAILHHALHVQILDTDHLVLANQRRGPFVREVGPSISDLTVELGHPGHRLPAAV